MAKDDAVSEHPASGGWASGALSRLFASRLGVLVAVPVLVMAVGVVFVVMGQSSLRVSIEASTHGKMMDLVRETGRAAEGWFAGVDVVLARLAAQAGHDDPAAGLRDLGETLFAFRPAMVRAGIAGDDSDLELVRGPDGVRQVPGRPGPIAAWRAAAAASTAIVWTQPQPGSDREVVAALAVRGGDGRVQAVVHAHFDLAQVEGAAQAMVRSMVAMPPPPDGVGGGPPSGRARPSLQDPEADVLFCAADGRLLASAARDGLGAPVIAAVAPRLAGGPGSVYLTTVIDGAEALVAARRLDLPGAPPWYAVIHIRRDQFAAPALAHLHRSLLIGLVVLAVSVGLAVGLARHIARQRRIASEARAQAASAEERLRALGSYRLIRKLGEGGMGTVWIAEHEMLARPAAVKLIQLDDLGTGGKRDQACARFEREAKVTAALRSRNTVTLYDYGLAADGSFYYAMELLDGMDLDRLVLRHGRQRPGRVLSILEQACRSLIEAHAHGMVHRDIKPANLFLCRLGAEVDIVKVLDFGLVSEPERKDGRLSRPGVVQGTPAFMAPEQARGLAVDARTDLYALGCVGYWLLAGRQVFDAPDSVSLMAAHLAEAPMGLGVPVPPALDALIFALLEKDPVRRPATARAVLDALVAIRCPPEQQWTPADAEGWWRFNHPEPSEPAPAAAGSPPSILMPARSALMDTASAGISVVLPGAAPDRA